MTTLRPNADTAHVTAKDWYDAYGASEPVRYVDEVYGPSETDMLIQAVPYSWLDSDMSDEDMVEMLLREDPELVDDGGLDALIGCARSAYDAAEGTSDLLDEAVAAYRRGDLDECEQALDNASSHETDHGDDPATQALRSQLIDDGNDS